VIMQDFLEVLIMNGASPGSAAKLLVVVVLVVTA
jgi:hypothetical protein